MCKTPEQRARLEALEEAYFSGVLQVSHGDKTVRYRSLDELWTALQRHKELCGCGAGAAGGAHRTRYGRYTKGL